MRYFDRADWAGMIRRSSDLPTQCPRAPSHDRADACMIELHDSVTPTFGLVRRRRNRSRLPRRRWTDGNKRRRDSRVQPQSALETRTRKRAFQQSRQGGRAPGTHGESRTGPAGPELRGTVSFAGLRFAFRAVMVIFLRSHQGQGCTQQSHQEHTPRSPPRYCSTPLQHPFPYWYSDRSATLIPR